MEGKEGRGAELAVAEGAPLLCTFGERNGDKDVTVGTGGERAVEVGWTAVGRRWAIAACLPKGFKTFSFSFFISFFL